MSGLKDHDSEEEKKKKRGLFVSLLRLFKSSSLPGVGGGGIFSSNAGVMGAVLGGATIAAGVGVVYNFIGPSSKPLSAPGLFQNSYYESVTKQAEAERAAQSDSSAGSASSSLEYFKEEAKKDQIAGIAAGEAPGTDNTADNKGQAHGGGDGALPAGANAAPAPDAAAVKPMLVKSQGFGAQGGGSKFAGGIGGAGGQAPQFPGGFNPLSAVKSGNPAALSGSVTSRSVARRAVPGFNKKGAFGQAKYAGNLSKNAVYSGSNTSMKSTAEAAFGGQTGASADLASSGAGSSGINSGSGLTAGNLKTSDPDLVRTKEKVDPPAASPPKDVSPWKEKTDLALNLLLVAAGLIVLTHILSAFGKANPLVYQFAILAAGIAVLLSAAVAFIGTQIMSEYGQTGLGMTYIILGGTLAFAAIQALSGVGKAAMANKVKLGVLGKLPGVGGGFKSSAATSAAPAALKVAGNVLPNTDFGDNIDPTDVKSKDITGDG